MLARHLNARDYIACGCADTFDRSVGPFYFPRGGATANTPTRGRGREHPFHVPLDECTSEDLELIEDGDRILFPPCFDKAPDAGNASLKFMPLIDEHGYEIRCLSGIAEWGERETRANAAYPAPAPPGRNP